MVHLGVVVVLQATVVRVLVVVEDDLLVHRLEGDRLHTHRNISTTADSPCARASISPIVVYAANDARVVAGTP